LGGDVSARVSVRNAGTLNHAGHVTVQVVAYGLVDGATPPVLSGNGWSCDGDTRQCTHAGPVPAGGALSDLTLSTKAGPGDERVQMAVHDVAAVPSAQRQADATVPVGVGEHRD
jgi:hypothetical protein